MTRSALSRALASRLRPRLPQRRSQPRPGYRKSSCWPGPPPSQNRSPTIVRTSFTLAQSSVIIGDWAAKNGIRKVATLTTDYAPGNDALQFFKARFLAGGGEIVDEVKIPPGARERR